MPTTVTNSIGSGARDYATIALWEDATDINLVSADEVRVGECYNDSEFALGAGVSLAGATTDATRYRHLTTASGQSFADHADKLTNPLKYDQTKGVGLASSTYGATVLYLEEDYSRVSKLQLNVTANANIGIRFENANNSARDCLVDGTYRSYGFDISRGTCVNCIAIVRSTGFAVYGFRFFYYGSNAQKVYNCTAVRPSDLAGTVGAGFRGHSVGLTPIAKNCASFGFTGGAGGFANITTWGTGSDYNATDSASATAGANDLTSLTYADQYESDARFPSQERQRYRECGHPRSDQHERFRHRGAG